VADVPDPKERPAGYEGDVLSVDPAGGPFPVRLRLHADGIGDAGWLLLGPRPDDSLIGRDERVVLREIGDPLARALLVATERQTALAAIEARFGAIERRLAELSSVPLTLRAPSVA